MLEDGVVEEEHLLTGLLLLFASQLLLEMRPQRLLKVRDVECRLAEDVEHREAAARRTQARVAIVDERVALRVLRRDVVHAAAKMESGSDIFVVNIESHKIRHGTVQ